MRRMATELLIVLAACGVLAGSLTAESTSGRDARMAWWREARFGMFVHWGLYSGLAGTWDGKAVATSGGTLDGVTVNGDLDLSVFNTHVTVINGLVLNGTATLGTHTRMYFSNGSQTLGGTGTVVFNDGRAASPRRRP